MKPLRTVETRALKALVIGLCQSGDISIMTRKTLKSRIKTCYDDMITELKNALAKAQYECTTADIWSSCNRSFLGMTAHWFKCENGKITRQSAALTCLRFKG